MVQLFAPAIQHGRYNGPKMVLFLGRNFVSAFSTQKSKNLRTFPKPRFFATLALVSGDWQLRASARVLAARSAPSVVQRCY